MQKINNYINITYKVVPRALSVGLYYEIVLSCYSSSAGLGRKNMIRIPGEYMMAPVANNFICAVTRLWELKERHLKQMKSVRNKKNNIIQMLKPKCLV